MVIEPQPPLAAPTDERPAVAWRARDLIGAGLLGVVLMIPVIAFQVRDASSPSLGTYALAGLMVYIALFFTTWWLGLKRRGATLWDAGFRRVSLGTLAKMIPVTIGMMIVTALVVTLSAQVFGDVPTAQDQVGAGDATSLAFSDFLWIFAVGAIGAPIAEEFLFRGMLYRLLRVRMQVVVAVGLSALAFAFLHFIPPLVPALLVMGIVLAVVAERYDSLYPAMVVHALNNGFAIIALYIALS